MNSDRFILNRNNLDADSANYWLNHETVDEQMNSYFKNTPITKQDINYRRRVAQQKRINAVLGVNERTSRILPYQLNSNKRLTVKHENKQWPVFARTKAIYKPQYAVLDLPNIRKDIRSNVVQWAANNHIIAALNKTIYLWRVSTATMSQRINCLHEIMSLRSDIVGSAMAYAGLNRIGSQIKIWNVETATIINERRLDICYHLCFITAIEYHPSNKCIVVGCEKGNLCIVTTSLKTVNSVENAHKEEIVRIKCSPDGRHIATSGYEGYIKIWLFPDLKLLFSYRETYCCKGISWHPWRTSYVCCGSTAGSLALLNTSLAKCIHRTVDKSSIIYDLTFNKLSAELVASYTVCNFHETPCTYKSQINVLANFNQVVDRFEGHCGRILYLEWSPNNEVLASVGSDETIHLWHFFGKDQQYIQKNNISTSFNRNFEIVIR